MMNKETEQKRTITLELSETICALLEVLGEARQVLKPVSTETRNGRHHGRFEEWLEAHCETLGMRMARYYYMQMALRWETLGIPQKKAVEGLKSFRQIRDALLDQLGHGLDVN